jgi:hypothetical protein
MRRIHAIYIPGLRRRGIHSGGCKGVGYININGPRHFVLLSYCFIIILIINYKL